MSRLDAVWSSKSDEWSTPKELFDELNKEFGFTLDPCSTDDNHLCDKYYTVQDNGLDQAWGGERVFCNPPYSEISKWCEKAFYESKNPNTLIVMLIPSRTDTRYFHVYFLHRTEIIFVNCRFKFGYSKNSAPFPSMIVIFRGAKKKKKKRGGLTKDWIQQDLGTLSKYDSFFPSIQGKKKKKNGSFNRRRQTA